MTKPRHNLVLEVSLLDFAAKIGAILLRSREAETRERAEKALRALLPPSSVDKMCQAD